jgi:hypothetical protein
MEPTDITVSILKDIRDEVRTGLDQVRGEVHELRVEVRELRADTNLRIDTLREELSRRIVESEICTATAITELSGTVREMTQVLRASHDLRPRLERCE